MTSLFWGLKMEPGKRYSTTVDKSFHISMATLDPQSVTSDNEIISVILEENGGGIFFLTNLRKKDKLSSNMDLNFMTGDKITLFCKGVGVVHLSGFMTPDDDELSAGMIDDEAEDEEMEEEEEIEDDDDEVPMLQAKGGAKKVGKNDVGSKRKLETEKTNKAKKKKIEILDKEDDSDEDSEDMNADDLKALMESGMAEQDSDEDEEEDEDDEDDEDDEEDEDEEEEMPFPVKKQKKQQNNVTAIQQNQESKKNKGAPQKQNQKTPNGTASPQQKGGKKEEGRKSLDGGKQQNQQLGAETTLTGGVRVKDLKKGSGAPCKPGRTAVVYYTGRLKSNGKIFDSTTQGSGFKFKVGQGEVIKGWDTGILGMQVGGKRIITCPPQVAYGQKGAPPQIPPNSTLVFEVELRNVI